MSSQNSNPSQLQVAGVVTFYMIAAIVMVLVNKAVLDSAPDLPFTFLFIQLFIAVILLHLTSFISSTRLGGLMMGKVELPAFDVQVIRKLIPFAFVGIVALIFNTLCLKDVDASFFQIARGLLLPFTIIVSAIHTRQLPGRSSIGAALVVSAGFFLGLSPTSFFNSKSVSQATALSLFYGVFSALMTAVHAVLVKSAYEIVGDDSVIKLAYWGNLLPALFLLPCVFVHGELGAIYHDRDWTVFIAGTAITGVFGFFLCMAGLLSIKVTSPITHMFSSAARSVVQTLLGALLFGDIITSSRMGSIFIILVGTISYTWIKSSTPPPTEPERLVDVDCEKQASPVEKEVLLDLSSEKEDESHL
jgi:GDP-fucose transporter C1